MRSGIITFTTDFGCTDPWTAVMKGVILKINGQADLIDISNNVPSCDIRSACYLLASSSNWFPRGTVHLAVVDPGVGGSRRAVAIQCENQLYVGPDNGIFTLALRSDKVIGAVELRPGKWTLENVSKTFHGRDIFAPVAAHLSNGVNLDTLGNEIDPESLVKLDLPVNKIDSVKAQAEIIHCDKFGNLITSFNIKDFERPVISVQLCGKEVKMHSTYSDVKCGEPLAYWGSSGYLEIAVNTGKASEYFGAETGNFVDIKLGR